jgi:hypothetical protein
VRAALVLVLLSASLLSASLLAGCGDPPAPREPGVVPTEPSEPLPPAAGAWDGHGAAPLPVARAAPRDRRRMDVDQLDASIRVATNGIGWDVSGVDQLQKLSATLGKPDYLANTYEDLTPNLLFEKFLEDASAAVCDQLLTRERTGSPDNVFLVHAEPDDTAQADAAAVRENLAYLLLRFHGRVVAPDSAELEPWAFLFEGAELAGGGDPIVAWRTVCVALLTHPDFSSY